MRGLAVRSWVRWRARRNGGRFIPSFEIVDVLDRTTDLGGDRLAFVEEYFRSEFANADVPRLTTQSETLLSLASAAREAPRWRGMYRLHQTMSLAGPQTLKPMLRDHVAPCFFELYPEGKTAVIRRAFQQRIHKHSSTMWIGS